MKINKVYFVYIVKLYTKNFFILSFGLSFIFGLIDYLNSSSEIQGSANQHILYIYYILQKAVDIVYPLSLIFAVIMTKIDMVKQNTIGALYSFGYSSTSILSPILLVALLVYLSFVWLQTTSFARANSDAFAIKLGQDNHSSENLFFKYHDTFVYINELNGINKQIYGLSLFKTKDNQVLYTIRAKNARFDGKAWNIIDGQMQTHIYDKRGILVRYKDSFHGNFITLNGYKPSVMEALHNGQEMKIGDVVRGIRLLKNQGLDTTKIRSYLYEKVIFPIFVFGLIVILFYKIPSYARFSNSALVSAISIGASLVAWAILIGLGRLGTSGVVYPEIAYGLPVLLIALYALWLIRKETRIS